MELYFLKSAACLAILLVFYKLFLERENMHIFKRFYLLTSVVAAIAIPAITFTTYVEPSSEIFKQVWISSEASSEITSVNYWPYFFTGIYTLGVLFFSIKFIRNLRDLVLKIKRNEKIRENEFTNVLLSEKTPPHTFFHFIFFNKQKYLRNEIPQDVKVHEEAHARQKHSLDVIFVELLQIIFWINPLIFLLKNAIKLNHEFLADRAVMQQGYSTAGYQQTLLSYSSKDLQSDLVNPINYSSIKKRFKVMKTQTSRNAIWARGLLILPLISFLFFSFSNKEIVEKEINPLTTEASNTSTLLLEVDEKGKIFFKNAEVEISQIRKYISNGSYTSYHIEIAENSSPSILKDIIKLMAENKLAGSVTTCSITEKAFQQIKPDKNVLDSIKISEVIIIKILKNGNLLLNQKPTQLTSLNSDIRNISRKSTIASDKQISKVYIEAFPKTPMGIITDIKEILRKAGVSEIYFSMEEEQVSEVKGDKTYQAVKDFSQEKATPEMIKEYNRLVKHYNSIPKEKFSMTQEDANKIMAIRGKMSPEQKEKAEKIKFKILPPPPPVPAPAPESIPGKEKVPSPPAPTAPAPEPIPGSENIPPPPPPPTFKDLVERGAKFYYMDKIINPEEARKLVEVEKKVNVEIIDIDKKPIVKLTDKN